MIREGRIAVTGTTKKAALKGIAVTGTTKKAALKGIAVTGTTKKQRKQH